MTVSAPKQADDGQTINIEALVMDQGKPVANAAVKFYLKLSFFATGLMRLEGIMLPVRG